MEEENEVIDGEKQDYDSNDEDDEDDDTNYDRSFSKYVVQMKNLAKFDSSFKSFLEDISKNLPKNYVEQLAKYLDKEKEIKGLFGVVNSDGKMYEKFDTQRAILTCVVNSPFIFESFQSIELMAKADFSEQILYTVFDKLSKLKCKNQN